MRLWFVLLICNYLLLLCQFAIWLMTKVRSRMAANHLVLAQGEITSTIQNVRMWIRNEKECH